jgi:anti-anti-sigma factor
VACGSYGREIPAQQAYPAGPGLAITVEHHDDRVVLHLHGELDVGSRESLCRAIRGLLGLHRQTLVLELSGLGFLDCSGLSVLVWAHRQLAGDGRQLIVTRGQPVVNRLLRLTGLDTYLHVSDPLPGHHELGLAGRPVVLQAGDGRRRYSGWAVPAR